MRLEDNREKSFLGDWWGLCPASLRHDNFFFTFGHFSSLKADDTWILLWCGKWNSVLKSSHLKTATAFHKEFCQETLYFAFHLGRSAVGRKFPFLPWSTLINSWSDRIKIPFDACFPDICIFESADATQPSYWQSSYLPQQSKRGSVKLF